jgi:hypothetical protein
MPIFTLEIPTPANHLPLDCEEESSMDRKESQEITKSFDFYFFIVQVLE